MEAAATQSIRGVFALEIVSLSFKYGAKLALEDVSFTVSPGQFKVLLGPNGAGKTTLFSLITRLYASSQGRIFVDGLDLGQDSLPALACMGVVFQQATLDLDLSVRQNLNYHGALHGMSRKQAGARIEEELARMDMAQRADEKVRQLNGGHRRRVEIARALMHRPKLLLLDEPTVGLDVHSRHDLVEHVHGLARDGGIAVLWATHLIDEVHDDDSVTILHHGKVRADGTVTEVNATTQSRHIREAFDSVTGDTAARKSRS